MTAFVAVAAGPAASIGPQVRTALLAAGASAVLGWADLADLTDGSDSGSDCGDGLAILFDPEPEPARASALAAALSALVQLDGVGGPASGRPGAVIVSTRAVTDTLKLVDGAGTLTGTADREEHRFVGPPIAAPLRVLRSVLDAGPDPVAILTALAARGVTMIGIAS